MILKIIIKQIYLIKTIYNFWFTVIINHKLMSLYNKFIIFNLFIIIVIFEISSINKEVMITFLLCIIL
jgi:hypothetical protein